MKMTESQKVAAAAWRIRRYALQMGEVQGQGLYRPGAGLCRCARHRLQPCHDLSPGRSRVGGRDRFLLSHGHYAIAYYAALLEAGIIPEAELETYGSDDSRLPMSGMATYTPGMEMSGGSLGQGLSIAVGMALGLRQKQSKAWSTTPCPMGSWTKGRLEAAMSAAHYGLSNLINLVDVNKQQADGDSRKILGFEPLQDKWAAFGWYVQRVDGNDLPAVMAAFDNAKSYSGNQPRVILCDTLMGKGVPFLETRDKNHFIRVDADEWQKRSRCWTLTNRKECCNEPESTPFKNVGDDRLDC